jgi:membrane-associated phospholipid phosphatase
MDKTVINGLNLIGANGAYVLGTVGVIRLLTRVRYLVAFLVICVININLIKCTKIIIRDPRPKPMISDTSDPEYYGMPSGHAYHVAFITAFLWLVCPSIPVLYFCLFIVCITLTERYVHKRHTVKQLFAGLIFGGVFAYICVWILRQYFVVFTQKST